jgi:murein DD-endopeptidase MepM/ murein hydrolase activator NlpD
MAVAKQEAVGEGETQTARAPYESGERRKLIGCQNHMPLLFLIFLSFSSLAKTDPQAVTITARPDPIYIEKDAAGQYLNFDFVVENLTDEVLLVSGIEVSVFDGKGQMILRKFVDGNGTSPSILTVSNRELEPKKSTLIFNPFYAFAARVELARLGYRFSFQSKDQKREYQASIEVSASLYQTKTDLLLPLKGRTIVYDGHDFYAHHRRFDYRLPLLQQLGFNSNFMRYSYDFCPVNKQGEMYKGKAENNEDWFGFGMPIYASGNGKVAAASDGMADNRSFDESMLAKKPMVLFGNYVVLDHGNGEYSLFAHLKQGSIQVKVGEIIKQGQPIAQIGASGSANIPHLHYELQNGIDTKAEGLPSYFRKFQYVVGAKVIPVKIGRVDSGDIIQR